MLKQGGACDEGSRVTKMDVTAEAEVRKRFEAKMLDPLISLWTLSTIWCIFQHAECQAWLWVYVAEFEVSDLFVLHDPG